ncbi:fructose-6-phosphate aldolase [Carboxydochorda subterranea]|uniref:Probable transaldolase n=1 Tax=Carboxydichorda subterranea TaxID=3109565 RepID=A0ABZ1BYZ8_9FIRM|nr:fructose-6-phosphate aldolase [Limnochorda sp. L945t]WRP18026.1 fructose-6-phosphate aldolase [Limnochorda sp. L945t]
MQIFLDTASVAEIREAVSWGVVSGVTTNPTLVSKEGRPFLSVVEEICQIVKGPVSAEAVSEDADGMVREARELSRVAPNVVVKIPITPEGLKAVSRVSREGIRTNVTLIFSPLQALLAARAGAAFVSPFVGRLDDIGHVGMDVVRDTVDIFEIHGIETQVIAASIRHPVHVLEAAKAGAHIATVPFGVLKAMVQHPLTDRGIERFLADWAKVPGASRPGQGGGPAGS